MRIKKRLSLSIFVTIIKIGLIELFFALNFSNFSYHKVVINPWISYPVVLVSTTIFFWLLTYFENVVKNIRRPRVVFLQFALIVQVISMSITLFCGFSEKIKDIATIFSLILAEIIADFVFGYSLYYSSMINLKS